ncbi:MAG TPA: sigma-70 family RNA polymerase sigma factor [Candidatus Limnocylindrales bacterium]|nr:sigma-70 family RNA polymerase sigma factor [Candidatus Limnocylindrales bacterium]
MTDSAQPLDDQLIAERLRSGDREALGMLYDRYASVAMAVAVRVVSDRELAEDLVHDAYVAVWQKIDRFDPKRGSIRSWLLTIVRNRAIDRLRGTRPSIELGEADEQSLLRTGANPTWEATIQRRSAAELREALAQLPDEQRQAVELAYFGGRTYREIAVLTGVAQGTANGRLRLALAKLRDSLSLTDAAPLSALPDRMSAERMDR